MRHGTLIKQGSRASVYRVQSFSVQFRIIWKPCEHEHIAYCILHTDQDLKQGSDKIMFVMTKVLSQETHVCHDKHNFVATKLLLQKVYFCHNKRCVLSWQTCVCHDKSLDITTLVDWAWNTHLLTYLLTCHDKCMFVATKNLLQQKWCLWQLLPMIHLRTTKLSSAKCVFENFSYICKHFVKSNPHNQSLHKYKRKCTETSNNFFNRESLQYCPCLKKKKASI